MKFRYTILYVNSVAKSLEFYEQALGLSRGFLHETGDYGEVITGETKLAFSSKDLMRQLGKNPAQAKADAPVFEIAFETDDVEAAYQAAITAGAVAVQGPTQQPWGQVVSYVADPDGYLVEICSPVANPG